MKLRYQNDGAGLPFMQLQSNPRFTGLVVSDTAQVVAGLGKNLDLAWSSPHAPYALHDWFVSDGDFPIAFVYNAGSVSAYTFPEKSPQVLDDGGGIETGAGWGDLGVWIKTKAATSLRGYVKDEQGVRTLLDSTPGTDKTIKLCVSSKWIWGLAGTGMGGFYKSLRVWRIPFTTVKFSGVPEVLELPWPTEASPGQFACGNEWLAVPNLPIGAVGIRWNLYRPGSTEAWQLAESDPKKIQFDSVCATNDTALWVARGAPFGTSRIYKYDLGSIKTWATSPL